MGVRRFYLKVFKDLLRLPVEPTRQERDEEDLRRDECAHRKHRSGSHLRLHESGG